MTDIPSLKTHAESQLASIPPFGGPPTLAYANGSPALDGTLDDEESSTIKCICRFPDDDGSTVLCEKCDTWQHIVCYYESRDVPEVHECADCSPRQLDSKRAADVQRQLREVHNVGERKGRPKTATKSHKKKIKDAPGAVQTNGWGIHTNNDVHYVANRKSESPRDLLPPAKRPKTGHRATGSVNVLSSTPNLTPTVRKRASSAMYNGQQSPVKSPTSPHTNGYAIEEFSPEFLRLYRQPEPQPIPSNSYADIRITDEIFTWLKDREKLAEATNGMEPGQVFQRVEKSIEELDEMAPVITKRTEEDPNIVAHGLHPKWEYLTVESPVAQGSYIGELKGQIGKKADYELDPSNRWELLKHPEPFVFFPPHLPIYIDARREGTILRYTRRSCNPNMTIKIFTQSPELGCHFCFIATDDIQPGEELTIGWEISPEIRQLLSNSVTNGDLRKEGFKKVEQFANWVACVLANFGGCACDPHAPHKGRECLLERARPTATQSEPALHLHKPAKGRRPKKNQISPLSTGHAVNSRANSEAFLRDTHDDEHADLRSTSGSTRSKQGSRDNTPGTHFSLDGVDIKNSDREKRKIQQQERLFEQLEYDEQHGGKRRKRNSGGSNLNTPTVGSAKHLGYPDPFLPTTSNHKHRTPNGCNTRKSVGINGSRGSSSKTTGGSMQSPKPRPVYADASTQTEGTNHSSPPMSPALNQTPFQPPMSFKRKLLLQAKEERLQREKRRSVKKEFESPALRDVIESTPVARSAASLSHASANPDTAVWSGPGTYQDGQRAKDTSTTAAFGPSAESDPVPSSAEQVDVEMKDQLPLVDTVGDASTPSKENDPEGPVPPPPPWPSASSHTHTTPTQNQRPVDLAIQLPPSPDFSSNTPTLVTSSVVTPASVSSVITGGLLAQSPSTLVPPTALVSPSISSAVAGPTRKKFSLSDYMSRKKKLDQGTQSSGQSSGSPPNPMDISATETELSQAHMAPSEVAPKVEPESDKLLLLPHAAPSEVDPQVETELDKLATTDAMDES
ncbi:uncharacterized protein BDZ99DRAFT_395604 [Mytilinidion resinicola]|uniref:SET domain-containing protein n=1 Tax=Mytilinidion resinicola TaxID=574789 RepID=A0A6A6YAW0_9PEZI|nr:uncharacterized protein BDZ99DRAFT_395604 [Mytilinidion resinicola]KAF2805708.1 hypothetical protein BDZ99DRAFT_395604 [Mytilinidion resinicola]